MSAFEVVALIALMLALNPLGLGIANLALLRPPRPANAGTPPKVSVLIPARDEEDRLGPTLTAVLASRDVDLEVIVGDDHSTDGTAALIKTFMDNDGRVRTVTPPPLPEGWSGKQHACAFLAEQATHDTMIFMDADVVVAPDAVARIAAELERSGAGLVSGFPRQVTATFWEKLAIPMIHVLLIGYLPIIGMRKSPNPGFAAACGQLIAVKSEPYRRAGGHAAIRASMHDGVKLPRAFRKSGAMTDLFDATGLCDCRMYTSLAQVWSGFAKNATEGIATPVALPIWTVLLLGGHVLPWILLVYGLVGNAGTLGISVAATAVASGYAFRFLLAARFRQSWLGAALHPFGVLFMIVLQWWALFRHLSGTRGAWRGRTYAVDDGAAESKPGS